MFGLFRKKAPNQHTTKNKKISDFSDEEEYLIRQYDKEGWAPAQIAEELNCEADLIYRYKRYRIDREQQETQTKPQDPIRSKEQELKELELQAKINRMKSEQLAAEKKQALELKKLELEIKEKERDLEQEYSEDIEDLEEVNPELEIIGFLRDLMAKANNKQPEPQYQNTPYVHVFPKSPSAPFGTNSPDQDLTQFTSTDPRVSASDPDPKSKPQKKLNLSDQEIKERLKQAPKKYLMMAKIAREDELHEFLKKNAPEYDEDTRKRAVVMLKNGIY